MITCLGNLNVIKPEDRAKGRLARATRSIACHRHASCFKNNASYKSLRGVPDMPASWQIEVISAAEILSVRPT